MRSGLITAAVPARDGWRLRALSTVSWPDGRQTVVTLWTSDLGDFARCFDYFDATLRQVGGTCKRSGSGF